MKPKYEMVQILDGGNRRRDELTTPCRCGCRTIPYGSRGSNDTSIFSGNQLPRLSVVILYELMLRTGRPEAVSRVLAEGCSEQ
jgi:hypothetical protein